MGTNFYWKRLPREFEKYGLHVEQCVGDCKILWHIGKRSAAGLYCHECGTTLNKHGTDHVHNCKYSEWYEVCPICGKEGTPICSFRWTFLKHKWLIEHLAMADCRRKMIVDENDKEYTPQEFLYAVHTPVEYQLCSEFC